jgi:hypothetical protein
MGFLYGVDNGEKFQNSLKNKILIREVNFRVSEKFWNFWYRSELF